MSDWPPTVTVWDTWPKNSRDVVWLDGKPRCRRHRWMCLVPQIPRPGVIYSENPDEPYVCARCMQEALDRRG